MEKLGESNRLAPYVPRLVREWADSASPDSLHRRLDGTMVFVDISGFTALSERMARLGKLGPEAVTDVIAACFDGLLMAAYAYDGSLLKFGGDALLLMYRGEGHVERGAAAALAMRRRMTELRGVDTDVGRVRLGMTVGVHTGTFDYFLVGGPHRELIVAGPETTRLIVTEESAATGQIVISEAVAKRLHRANVGRQVAGGYLLHGRITAATSTVTFYDTRRDLSRFVPHLVGRSIVESHAMESEHRHVTVAFVAFEGLDQPIAEGRASEVADRLQRTLAIVGAAAQRHEVCLLASDIAGDGGKLILTAGAPAVTGNDEERMLLALRSIVDAGPPIALRIGINSGPVFAGEIGTIHRRNYTVMGDAVNLAARVMARAQPGQVLATPSVLDRSATLFQAEPLSPFTVKGKRHPVHASSVGAPRGVRHPVGAVQLPLVGRTTELAAFDAAYAGAAAGRGCCIEVVAEPGTGKSRLLASALERASGLAIHRAQCRLYQVTTPYQPVAQLLGSLLGLTGAHDQRVEQLRRLVQQAKPELAPWLSLIGASVQLSIEPTAAVERLDEAFRAARLESATADLVVATVNEPVVLCVEDAHWMDEASAGLMRAIIAAADRAPLVVVLTTRPSGAPDLGTAPRTRLVLSPLDPEDAVALLAAASLDHPLAAHVVAGLVRRSAGSPLFLLELLDAIRAGGEVDSLPDTVEAVINARIDRLPASDRVVLRRAAVLGAGFARTHAATVLTGLDPHAQLSRLPDFLTVDESGWVSFRHALVRDVAYAGLPFRVRRALHGQVADSIQNSESADEQSPMLSMHLLHAGRDAEAWMYARRAGDRATEVFANVDAAALFERALLAARRAGTIDDLDRARVYESLGDVYDASGSYQLARRAYAAARRLSGNDHSRVAELLLKSAYVAERQGRYPDAIRCVRRGLRALSDHVDNVDTRARLVAWEAAVRATQGRFQDARRGARQAVQLSRLAGDDRSLARSYLILDHASTSLGLGAGDEGEDAAAALAIFSRLGDLAGEAAAANNLGARYFYDGRWSEASTLYERARSARDRLGDPVNAAFCSVNQAEILVEQGRLAEAVPILRDALNVLRAADDRWAVGFAQQVLGVAEVRSGGLTSGRGRIDAARSTFDEIGAKASAIAVAVPEAEHFLLAGQPEQALAVLTSLTAAHDTDGEFEQHLPAVHRLRGWAFTQLGNTAEARRAFNDAAEQARRLDVRHELGLALDAIVALGIEDRNEDRPDTHQIATERDIIFAQLGILGRPHPFPHRVVSPA